MKIRCNQIVAALKYNLLKFLCLTVQHIKTAVSCVKKREIVCPLRRKKEKRNTKRNGIRKTPRANTQVIIMYISRRVALN